ncbi:hypothetical protein [Pleurocapsa sp. FMAR1]|uniref:hypothetical protein n=1 Tax=Pleurocapsa sp. FMAR1 TaxID=3040204 RepID=UPI0029C8D106|nr:hypothetical protein [Pleurocapsa sp. FMAR1]
MTKKQRKPLDDSLASEFVFGGDKPQTGAAPTPDIELGVEEESTPIAPIEEKLQVEAKEGTKGFTIDLKESIHRKLSILAAKAGRSKADIVIMLLDNALENVNE